ncbi:deoxynucleoside triphosphate triphosphohydrolase SAMHD1-like [Centruroides sculpturatus]|uniref:deoxynucleoside triphosphate triphosphohydrolase SAMHD1-like n=1 Tax=Centruroides sculpturatus TaxID=218467 RepID=UPI000C6D7901|nr:deoxynucleoside triphosphate triphosphohydrolase SAMHD1-like [Centruroides sculpturatus]
MRNLLKNITLRIHAMKTVHLAIPIAQSFERLQYMDFSQCFSIDRIPFVVKKPSELSKITAIIHPFLVQISLTLIYSETTGKLENSGFMSRFILQLQEYLGFSYELSTADNAERNNLLKNNTVHLAIPIAQSFESLQYMDFSQCFSIDRIPFVVKKPSELSKITAIIHPFLVQFKDINNNICEDNGNTQKIFCDPVHGQISFNALCLKIIDTPEFQRLRLIKQLGFLYTVYPGANNNRFEHSLGVAYLSKKFILELRNNQPELNITDQEINCVQIAGLCHHLGHGPFSHSWERFMRKCRKKRKDESKPWNHEEVSIKIFDYLVRKYKLEEEFQRYNIDKTKINFIRDLMKGKPTCDERTFLFQHEEVSIKIFDYLVRKYKLEEEFQRYNIDKTKINFIRDLMKGKPTCDERTFLFQIVNNEESGLDVDKWDYYFRDCLYLGIKCGFEYKRLMQFARVNDVDGKKVICFRDKVRNLLFNTFFKNIFDPLLEADGNVLAPNGKNFQFYNWTNAVNREEEYIALIMRNFCMMTDSAVYDSLKYSKIEKVRNILDIVERRFQNSKIYQTVSHWSVAEKPDKKTVKAAIMKCAQELSPDEKRDFYKKYETDFELREEHFKIQIVT